jgi:hypothetical protein
MASLTIALSLSKGMPILAKMSVSFISVQITAEILMFIRPFAV